MEDDQNLTYFFDDIANFMRVASEVFELYAEYITKSKFMHAKIKESVFEEGDKNHYENFMRVMKGEEPAGAEPEKSMKHILSLSLEKNAPLEEIDKCLWINGGWIGNYNDEWYETNAIEDMTYVSDKSKVMDEYKHHMRNMVKTVEN